MLVHVVGIRAVAKHGQTTLRRERDQALPQLGLAVEAPVRGIGEIIRVLELMRLDLDERNVELAGQLAGDPPLGIGIRGTAANRREHPVLPELLTQNNGQVGRIDAAGIPKQD